jgi:alginate O-acetyltransferase complex protein AlgI
MIFNSVTYLVFLTMVCALFWTLPKRPRLWMLFLSSLLFYGFWRIDFIPVMLFSAVVDYLVSLRLSSTTRTGQRKILLLVSLVLNMGLLFVFKYLQFATDTAYGLAEMMGSSARSPALGIVLPLGISFYTFQTISYTIDVYRKQVTPIRDFAAYGCYVTFFPQLVAGPILRVSEVCPQLEKRPQFDLENITNGVSRILAGLFLKVFLADNIAGFVNEGFSAAPGTLSALDVWTLSFLFGFQIYFDFSAYSHIAIGSARLMGIVFPENFCFPYLAMSPKDFWGRWHISLSSWIRDYLYLPLCGVKFGSQSTGGIGRALDRSDDKRRTWALIGTWTIMGLWHGAGFCFLLWGLYHALMIMLYRFSKPLRQSLPDTFRIVLGWCVTLPAMMAGWIFFRADSVANSLVMVRTILTPTAYGELGLRENNYLFAAFLLLSVSVAGISHQFISPWVKRRPAFAVPVYSVAYAVMFVAVFIFLRPVEQFIYFQF